MPRAVIGQRNDAELVAAQKLSIVRRLQFFDQRGLADLGNAVQSRGASGGLEGNEGEWLLGSVLRAWAMEN